MLPVFPPLRIPSINGSAPEKRGESVDRKIPPVPRRRGVEVRDSREDEIQYPENRAVGRRGITEITPLPKFKVERLPIGFDDAVLPAHDQTRKRTTCEPRLLRVLCEEVKKSLP